MIERKMGDRVFILPVKIDIGPWDVSYLQGNGQPPSVCSIFRECVGAIEGSSAG